MLPTPAKGRRFGMIHVDVTQRNSCTSAKAGIDGPTNQHRPPDRRASQPLLCPAANILTCPVLGELLVRHGAVVELVL